MLRLLPTESLASADSGLPSDVRDIYAASFGLLPRQWKATIEEGRAAIHFEEQVRDAEIVSLGDIPLIYLLAGRPDWSPGPEWSEELIDRRKELHRDGGVWIHPSLTRKGILQCSLGAERPPQPPERVYLLFRHGITAKIQTPF